MFKFTWYIENFCMLPQNTGEFIYSPTFEVKTMNDVKARIRLYPNGKLLDDWITFHMLPTEESQPFEVGTKVKLSFTKNRKSESEEWVVNSGNNREMRLAFERKHIEEDKFQDLFLFLDNVAIECVFKKPNSAASLSAITNFKKTVVQTETRDGGYFPLRDGMFSVSSSWEHEHSKIFSDNLIFILKVEKMLKNNTVEIRKLSAISTAVYVCLQISLIDDNTEENTVLVCDGNLFKTDGSENELWQKPFDINAFAIDKFTQLRCEIIVSKGSIVTVDQNVKKVLPTKLNSMESENYCHDILYKNMYEKKMFSDVILQVVDDQFPAHKCVLASVSDVFAAMFTTKMKEEETNVVNMMDTDKDIVDKMLQFVYGGEIECLDFLNLEMLYSAADKYQILELKKSCSLRLTETLTVGSCLDVLELADMHVDSVLEDAAQSFIYANNKELLASDNWKVFMEKHVKLAADVMFYICQRS